MLENYLILLIALLKFVQAENWSTYPAVPKTASINGFADPIYEKLPSCAQECVKYDTGNTPCPYWDTGCFCVMPQWAGQVAECFASACSGSDVDSATSLASSLCGSVGAKTWMIPPAASTAVQKAEQNAASATTTGSGASGSTTATGSESLNSLDSSPLATSTAATEDSSSAASSSQNDAMKLGTGILGLSFLGLLSLL